MSRKVCRFCDSIIACYLGTNTLSTFHDIAQYKMDEPMDDHYRDSSEAAADMAKIQAREARNIAIARSVTTGPPNGNRLIADLRDTRYRRTHVGAMENVQDRFELFILKDGETKVTEEPDTREYPHKRILGHVECLFFSDNSDA